MWNKLAQKVHEKMDMWSVDSFFTNTECNHRECVVKRDIVGQWTIYNSALGGGMDKSEDM